MRGFLSFEANGPSGYTAETHACHYNGIAIGHPWEHASPVYCIGITGT